MSVDLFGSPEPAREEPRVLSVSELTRAVRATLEDHIGQVWVEGEISNYRKQPSGHQYFTLKDEQSQVACVWFARGGLRMKQVALSDGMHVQVRGALTVYEARGQYQLNVQTVQAAGAGLLQAKFEALKRKLEAEGLFDPERKRPLPRFPMTIGLVTSSNAAALRDMLNILARRAPWVRVVINPVRVQGQGAAQEIAGAIAEFNDLKEQGILPLDVIVVGRGGGSIEDLWEFNEEIVARAIVQSAVPVVSAVGHEIDFTIADFAADLRAPTPSAAAELIVPDGEALRRYFVESRARLQRCAAGLLLRERNRLTYLSRVASPQTLLRTLREYTQRVDMAGEILRRTIQEQRLAAERRLLDLRARLREHLPDRHLPLYRHRLAAAQTRLANCARANLQKLQQRFAHAETLLKALSPDATLARGYSITSVQGGAIIRSAKDVAPQTKLTTRLKDGTIDSVVE
ncbi:exodeoxyribonuclease VII, large subunit [Chthoniobacter flavus Ellin428]|uniref:Exodeoxyribonuclease 7 large subunit n=1 Tax=Chthoniobacter flavus Ellin428 TaxID=497964 RepID=B4CWH1_9BACT|nr:exodeoxyribonuclease VII large subunit [Chthoniobacter flavus]EDY21763.1 exodeoxyribonuclease VII, large subunit [Chthoniobacter flavus Ellin428]TCO95695.1 exodeoxyribonuclease VII large subunit [Chthoniobacter flavus]